MPIYEYRCSACGVQKEFLQRFNEAPKTVCPKCGKSTLTKLVSAAGFQLKGTGWYATDFKNSGAKPAAKEKTDQKPGKETSATDTSAKETASKETSTKETANKETASKETSKKETSNKESSKAEPASSSSATSTRN